MVKKGNYPNIVLFQVSESFQFTRIYILFIDIIEHITHTHTDIYIYIHIYIYIYIHTYIFISCNTIQTIYHNIYIYTYYTTGHRHSHENHDDHDNNS